MKKNIRMLALLLAHIGVLLSIVFLIVFLVFSVKADRTAAALNDPETAETLSDRDLHLERAVNNADFSFLSVGKALSDKDDPGRDSFLLILDLIIPLLCLVSGILLQIAFVSKKRKRAVRQDDYHHSNIRRQS